MGTVVVTGVHTPFTISFDPEQTQAAEAGIQVDPVGQPHEVVKGL